MDFDIKTVAIDPKFEDGTYLPAIVKTNEILYALCGVPVEIGSALPKAKGTTKIDQESYLKLCAEMDRILEKERAIAWRLIADKIAEFKQKIQENSFQIKYE